MFEHVVVECHSTDMTAAHRVAARQAKRDQMPTTAERHENLAARIQAAVDWAVDHAPDGYSVTMEVHVNIVPNINPQYHHRMKEYDDG